MSAELPSLPNSSKVLAKESSQESEQSSDDGGRKTGIRESRSLPFEAGKCRKDLHYLAHRR